MILGAGIAVAVGVGGSGVAVGFSTLTWTFWLLFLSWLKAANTNNVVSSTVTLMASSCLRLLIGLFRLGPLISTLVVVPAMDHFSVVRFSSLRTNSSGLAVK